MVQHCIGVHKVTLDKPDGFLQEIVVHITHRGGDNMLRIAENTVCRNTFFFPIWCLAETYSRINFIVVIYRLVKPKG